VARARALFDAEVDIVVVDTAHGHSDGVRDMVVFSTHNVGKDAPFSRVDLITCRNLLIYMQPIMQKKVLRVLHYALNPTGYLMLGSSETVGATASGRPAIDWPSRRSTNVPAKRPIPTRPAASATLAMGDNDNARGCTSRCQKLNRGTGSRRTSSITRRRAA